MLQLYFQLTATLQCCTILVIELLTGEWIKQMQSSKNIARKTAENRQQSTAMEVANAYCSRGATAAHVELTCTTDLLFTVNEY